MICVFLLDNLGYHAAVEKYLQVFKGAQGSVVPPGDVFKPHAGYLAAPKSLTAINWLTDHGALLCATRRPKSRGCGPTGGITKV